MVKILIAYYSRTGNTKKMAEYVRDGAKEANALVDLKSVQEVEINSLLEYDAIILGSPTYYGVMASEMKKMLDESVKVHGKLVGKVGGAFASVGGVGGGAESTILSLLEALLIHGMIVQGNASGAHYGPVAVGAPGERAAQECRELGRRVASLAAKLSK